MKKVTEFINGKITYDKDGQYFWINNNGALQLLAQLRGWGAIQNMFKRSGKNSGQYIDEETAGKFQDEIGEWVADAINAKLEREREQLKISCNPVLSDSCPDSVHQSLKEHVGRHKCPKCGKIL